MMIDYCYHTHTKRCGHARGEDEEYVLNAISNGIKVLGFSDHVMLPHISQNGIRGDFSLLEDYLSSINRLKEKYKKQIEILIGFECEYLEDFVPYYKDLLRSKKIDYLILGQHCRIDKDNNVEWYFSKDTPLANYTKYKEDLIKGMRSGLFKYVAHPDFFVTSIKGEFDEFFINMSKEICECAQECHIPLEINLNGHHYYRPYPSKEFFSVAKDYSIDFIVGVDAHTPNDFARLKEDWYLSFINEYNLSILPRLKMKEY